VEGNPCAAQTVATGIVSFDDNIDRTTSEEVVPVALAGVVPVDVNDANGRIAIVNGCDPDIDLSGYEEKLARRVTLHGVDREEADRNFVETLANGIVLRGYLET